MENDEEIASDTFKKDRIINAPISSEDLNYLQTLALREGLPLHKNSPLPYIGTSQTKKYTFQMAISVK